MASEEITPASEPQKASPGLARMVEVVNGQRCPQCSKRMVINFGAEMQECWNCDFTTWL
jgi:ribosomal protein S27AE